MRGFLAGMIFLVVASTALGQGQFPVTEEERIFPHLTEVTPLPSLASPAASWPSRPVWYLSVGTRVRFKHDRLIVPHTTKYALGPGPVLSNQFLHLAPSDHERVLPKEIVYQVTAVHGVHAGARYSPHLLRPRHLVRLELRAESGQILELEICPGGQVTPTISQLAPYMEVVESPPAEVLH